MEGAAIGHVAYVNNVPFAVLRAISDGGDGMEFSEFVGLAAKISVSVTKKFLDNLN
jgi:adenosylhomocysteine nucleosidase